MKLSTAIRIGSMTTRQITGRFDDGGNGRCALGAALSAIEWKPSSLADLDFLAAQTKFPLCREIVAHPEVEGVFLQVIDAIWKLNDVYAWTRERIADWVETIESTDEQQTMETKEKEEFIKETV